MNMYANACLVTVIGLLSAVNAQDPFCSGDLCFIRPEPNSGKSWMAAQQTCKDNSATLPIADNSNSRKSFIEALNHFQLNGMEVWLGANASDDGPKNWHWLDGTQYIGHDVEQNGEYFKSYAYAAKTTFEGLAHASPPNASYSYICQCKAINPDSCTNGTGRTALVQQNGCFMRYDEKLSWFNARNKCLANSCDLASVTQLSILDGMVEFWIGLRASQWNWQNAVTGLSTDVTFTSWRIGQPNDADPHCIATDSSDFPNWKDADCYIAFQYICQVLDNSTFSTAAGPSSTTISIAPTSLSSTPTSTTTTKSELVTPGTGSTSLSSSRPLSSNTTEPSGSASEDENKRNSTSTDVNLPLAIGLGVGLGVGFIILIVVVVVVVAVVIRRKRQNSTEIRNAQSTKKFVTNTSEENADDGTMDRTEHKKKGRTQQDDSLDQYATVKAVDAKFDSPSNPGTVYADLRFNPDEP